ncbi:hypothetical protein BU16DRAFT_190281 [Lophium mytilinum]|uniref:Uncharacterized protein n=1 Tax=Lophium mytilinum TaxID=390894 RepID=A0A6A6RBL5_9PEZI|nr:hypothetical protein BU16DRAFT_190281 [Lophium mytilinum]
MIEHRQWEAAYFPGRTPWTALVNCALTVNKNQLPHHLNTFTLPMYPLALFGLQSRSAGLRYLARPITATLHNAQHNDLRQVQVARRKLQLPSKQQIRKTRLHRPSKDDPMVRTLSTREPDPRDDLPQFRL